MPKTVLSIIALLVTVFLVALGGSLTGNAIAGGSQHGDADVSSTAGTSGKDGADGLDGAAGPAGPEGEPGGEGLVGSPGSVGPAGARGTAGPKGATGARGAAGPQGPAGATGSPGPVGVPGADGADGVDGSDGADGDVDIRYDVARYGIDGSTETVAAFDPLLESGRWWLEVEWYSTQSGTCEVVGPAWRVSVDRGRTAFRISVTGNRHVTLECTSSGHFTVDAMLRASRE